MATTWQNFEIECYNYLKTKYPKAQFKAFGQSNSTSPDIFVSTSHDATFYIEIKSSNAQSGQFVLIPDEKRQCFDYSDRNQTPFFRITQIIIDHMNKNFIQYKSVGSAGQNIDIDKSIFYDWIKCYYSNKRVKYFITKGLDYIIFPIEKISEYFDVTCCYRMKRSGSSSAGSSNVPEIREALRASNIAANVTVNGGDVYVKTNSKIDGKKLQGEKYKYLFRKTENGNYNVRKLSNTTNSNVIFSISLKKYQQDSLDLQSFESSL
ncbi:MAG TPA: hypothetical protein GX704_03560 [Clostridiales bacterium]|jgi:hypothetical protein|nr:hypothetical protein [Clostridiales bacterium]